MEKAYIIKTVSPDVPGYSIPGVWDSLRKGKARIGWSYEDHLDLRKIQQKVHTGQILTQDEHKAWRCRAFLEDISNDDYLLYPHQPRYGFFAIA